MAMEEMSGRFFSNGQEITQAWWDQDRHDRRVRRARTRLDFGMKSLYWLQNRLGLPEGDFAHVILRMADEGSAPFYHVPKVIAKPKGGTRIIIAPRPELLQIQTRLNRLLQYTFKRPENVFGYRGGSCLDLAKRHVDWPSTLKFDIKDAFFRIDWLRVRNMLCSHPVFGEPGFSKNVAHWMAILCVHLSPPAEVYRRFPSISSFLPQGAPTSPICFDLACEDVDRRLAKIARRVGGIVSRFADNYYFSMPTSRFSPKLERMILCDVSSYGRFPVHKVCTVGQGELCRILGYNLVDGHVTNTKAFRRKLRGALHVLKTKLDRGLECREAYSRVKGCMGFAVNLPVQFQETYDYCESKISSF